MKTSPFWLKRVLVGALIGLAPFVVAAQAVNSFTVVNADTEAPIATFTSSGSISLKDTPRINVRANATGVGSVVFSDGSSSRTENVAPYAYKGDKNGNYAVWSPSAGTYRITAKPYSGSGGAGAAGPEAALTLTVTDGGPAITYNYELILGHDGHCDPDDNLAMLAGYFTASKAAAGSGGRVSVVALIYADTLETKSDELISGNGCNGVGKANRDYFIKFGKPALQSLGFNKFTDIAGESYNFNTTNVQALSTGGTLIAQRVQAAIGGTTRVVYSAGGGENTAAEAVAWLRKQGYSDVQIKNHFVVIQHSNWNWDNATEATARNIIDEFTIKIEDQNKFTGLGKPPVSISTAKTSAAFVNAWDVCQGTDPSGIPNFQTRNDASDAGSHSFASNINVLEANWNKRGIGGNTPSVSYSAYDAARMRSELQ
ncbi:MAG: hypothetical protein ACRCV9_00320 [Burkholderiaceae bacterium]